MPLSAQKQFEKRALKAIEDGDINFVARGKNKELFDDMKRKWEERNGRSSSEAASSTEPAPKKTKRTEPPPTPPPADSSSSSDSESDYETRRDSSPPVTKLPRNLDESRMQFFASPAVIQAMQEFDKAKGPVEETNVKEVAVKKVTLIDGRTPQEHEELLQRRAKNQVLNRPGCVKDMARHKILADKARRYAEMGRNWAKREVEDYKNKMNRYDYYGPDFVRDVENTANSWKTAGKLKRAQKSIPEHLKIVYGVLRPKAWLNDQELLNPWLNPEDSDHKEYLKTRGALGARRV